jgi:ferredoxin like protein
MNVVEKPEEHDRRSTSTASAVNVEEKLGVDKYDVDEGNAHIVLADDCDDAEFEKLVLACPAHLYRRGEDGGKTFDYAGCLECGTCRFLCGDTILQKWEYTRGTKGVEYRFG